MKKALSLLTVVLLLVAVVPSFVNLASAAPSYPEVWVDDDAPADWYDANHVDSIATAVSIVSPGGVIHVLPGTYEPQFYIWITKPLTILGEGMPVVKTAINILNTQDVVISGLNMTHSSIPDFFVVRNVTNVTIENSILGPLGSGVGVYVYDSKDVTFRSDTFQELNRQAIVIDGTVDSILVENSRFIKTAQGVSYTAAIHFPGTARVTNAVIRGNVFTDNYQYDILASYNSMVSLMVENNTFTRDVQNMSAVKSYTREKVVVKGNFVSNYQSGIYVDHSDGTVIEDNVVMDCTFGIFVYELENGTVRNNKVSRSNYGIHLRDLVSSIAEGNELSGNSIGINLHSTTNTTVVHNVFINNTQGINTHGSQNVGIHYNIIISGIQSGITLYKTEGVNITHTYISGYSSGVFVWDSSGIEVHYNSILGNGIGVRTSFHDISPAWVNATLNWWGAEDGPSAIPDMAYHGEIPAGSGDSIYDYVHFDPWIGETPEATYSDLQVSKTVVSPGDTITVSATVENTNEIPIGYTAELKVNGNVNETEKGALLPGESATVTFDLTLNAPGTYSVTIDGLPPVDVHVVGAAQGSPLAVYNTYYRMAIIWTNLFFSESDDFNELYEEASNAGVDNETLTSAMQAYNEAVDMLLHAWNEESLEHLRLTLWTMRGVIPRIYEVREAYVKIKEAVAILESAME
ncbi:right-handed parallel beta-helix repeat-containing protein [Thermococcus radiotolerans]|uniref:Right handed beta helix domain-containing protein n=1 Tax=Thermococcus radiotolerans TaxID=187880 RepID=A0A2Z2N3U8_9EURY|nr:NosD domain-containing protein [Thermococcus radiotolerans]ASJ15050.1 hypothetical protein A3L10_07885 [Thermococcus radiotolerans]